MHGVGAKTLPCLVLICSRALLSPERRPSPTTTFKHGLRPGSPVQKAKQHTSTHTDCLLLPWAVPACQCPWGRALCLIATLVLLPFHPAVGHPILTSRVLPQPNVCLPVPDAANRPWAPQAGGLPRAAASGSLGRAAASCHSQLCSASIHITTSSWSGAAAESLRAFDEFRPGVEVKVGGRSGGCPWMCTVSGACSDSTTRTPFEFLAIHVVPVHCAS